jgi:predicted transcriptional regulator of viral defense system
MRDPELPAYVTLDEVVEVSGIERETLRRHLKRRGALRRIGNAHSTVDTSALATVEPPLYRLLLQRRVQRALEIEDGS